MAMFEQWWRSSPLSADTDVWLCRAHSRRHRFMKDQPRNAPLSAAATVVSGLYLGTVEVIFLFGPLEYLKVCEYLLLRVNIHMHRYK